MGGRRMEWARGWRVVGVAALVAGCSGATGPEACSGAAALALEGGVCLDFSGAAALGSHRAALEEAVVRTLAAVNARMPVDDVRIRVLTDRTGVIPEVGLGGYAASGREVHLSVDLQRPDLTEVIERDLLPLLAHELHHARRMRTVGYGATLFEAAVSEGLADHFSVEVAGIDPPLWSVALSGAALEAWTELLLTEPAGPYDHSAWFFGSRGDVPRWTGYAVGYRVVGRFLAVAPGRRASLLVSEPAASFRP